MLPSRTDPRWRELVQHPKKHTYDFLALRILMQRMSWAANSADGDDRDLEAAVEEVHSLFEANEPLMTQDIENLFG